MQEKSPAGHELAMLLFMVSAIKGNSADFLRIKVCLQVLESATAYVKKLAEAFCGSRGSCKKSDELLHVGCG